jgi:hypothetical protein
MGGIAVHWLTDRFGSIPAGRSRFLPFLNTYRTMCIAPNDEFRTILEDVRLLGAAA